jgi:3'-phosphoadenosine 5'-phosphosulfate sulfotransferase (PAPS reductase)/FAD synthetase
MKHIVSFSGGKDSSAMLLRMIEMGMPVDLVLFADTGMEFPQLYMYVERMKTYVQSLGIEFRTVKPEKTWDDWFFGKVTRGKMEGQQRGWPLMFFHCYWSREAKFKTMDPICLGNYRYIGFGADESKRVTAGRKKDGYRFPLADWGWTEARALEYLKEVGWCEQYHLDFNRTGCFLCPKQGEKALRTIYKKYPNEWKRLIWYAERANNDFKPGITIEDLRNIEKGILPSSKPKNPNQTCLNFD